MDRELMQFDKEDGSRFSFPFFAWQCLTLEMGGRNIDLVIKNDEDMTLLIRYLIQAMNTCDGKANSANFLIDAGALTEIQRREKKLNKRVLKIRKVTPIQDDEEYDESLELKKIHDYERRQIRENMAKEVYRQTMFKYLLMKVRIKIGYAAFQKRMTISELFIDRIYSSYKALTRTNSIPEIAPYPQQLLQEFDELLDS